MGIARELSDLGNTVLVDEHDPDVIAQADHIIELGPEGGERGGQLLFEGDYTDLRSSESTTGRMLRDQSRYKQKSDFESIQGYLTHICVNFHYFNIIHADISLELLHAVNIVREF